VLDDMEFEGRIVHAPWGTTDATPAFSDGPAFPHPHDAGDTVSLLLGRHARILVNETLN
jgi:hypothetical protein